MIFSTNDWINHRNSSLEGLVLKPDVLGWKHSKFIAYLSRHFSSNNHELGLSWEDSFCKHWWLNMIYSICPLYCVSREVQAHKVISGGIVFPNKLAYGGLLNISRWKTWIRGNEGWKCRRIVCYIQETPQPLITWRSARTDQMLADQQADAEWPFYF